MQSLAHNDRSRYMWDGIVCLADKPVEPEECMCKAGECVRDISIPALVCVLLHASENASVREISLSRSLSPSLPPPTGTQKPSPLVLCCMHLLEGFDVTERGESLHVETWPCIAKQRKKKEKKVGRVWKRSMTQEEFAKISS